MHRIVTVSHNNKDLCVFDSRDFLNDSITLLALAVILDPSKASGETHVYI